MTDAAAAHVGGFMGVYELADDKGIVIRIGYAGGNSRFGLGGELRAHVGTAPSFRYEVTTAYISRYLELLMVHQHDHGALPRLNDDDPARLGRMSPG